MLEQISERLKDREICRSFQIQNPSRLFSLIILFKADGPKGLEELTSAIIDTVWLSDKCYNHIPIGCFVQQYLRVAGCDHLASL